ncbi:MAG: DNA polymerase III subunit gamma/tau [Ruminococcaceae bacterium]|nr:DNA polymerase III subunit gamma/tau [Oscillospiraceae bacterium]
MATQNGHQALYRKWRPTTFSDVVGQDHITSVLKYQVSQGKTNHAYLFCGSRGTGKTTCAKILAKAVNCPNSKNGEPCNECEICRRIDSGMSMEVLEMDAASNTGVDYIRDIREEVVFSPSEVGTRVYIIDEVHMLTESAFNALLKTLEEPPQKVIFILATTEIQKIPATILSRCQRFDFRRIPANTISSRLVKISEQEGIEITESAAHLIAKLAQGGMRDAISMLELCSGEGDKITEERISEATGIIGRESIIRTVKAVLSGNYGEIFGMISSVYSNSYDISSFISEIMQFYRDVAIYKTLASKTGEISREILDLSDAELAEVAAIAEKVRHETVIYHIKLLEEAFLSMSRGTDKRISAEMTLMRMCSGDVLGTSNEALAERISSLEARFTEGGIFSAPRPTFDSNREAPKPKAIISDSTPKPVKEEKEEAKPSENAEIPIAIISDDELPPWDEADTQPKEEAPVSVKKPETAEKEEIAVKKPASAAEVDTDAAETSDGPEWSEFPDWIEVVSQYDKIDRSIAPFLRLASADTDGKTLRIKVSDSFSKMMLENAKVEDFIMRFSASRGFMFEKVVIEVSAVKEDQVSMFDGLI